MRHPGDQRYAVLAPYCAAWVLRALERSGETPAVVLDQVRHLRAVGAPGFAVQLEGGMRQLRHAAADHRSNATEAGDTGRSAASEGAARVGTLAARARAVRRSGRRSR